MSRIVSKVATGIDVKDGAGVKLKRVIGGSIKSLDPFLMLDEFKSDNKDDYIKGFPSHPHRGFETATIMISGSMEHRDNHGNHGILGPGSVQWMTAGKGIIHSEMPKKDMEGLMHGFQLWINLPSTHKMIEPRYQDITAENIPIYEKEGIRVRVLAGQFQDVIGPVKGIHVKPTLLDVTLQPNTKFTEPIPFGHTAYAYVFQGKGIFGEFDSKDSKLVNTSQIAILESFDSEERDRVEVLSSTEGVRFLLVAGAPIKEPVAKYGPFVMNTEDELQQAFEDYHNGKF